MLLQPIRVILESFARGRQGLEVLPPGFDFAQEGLEFLDLFVREDERCGSQSKAKGAGALPPMLKAAEGLVKGDSHRGKECEAEEGEQSCIFHILILIFD